MSSSYSLPQASRNPRPATTATTLQNRSLSQNASQWPSPAQQQSVAALSSLGDTDIFSHLANLRQLSSQLTDQQLGALIHLRTAPDEYIKSWLDFFRRSSFSAHSDRSSLLSHLTSSSNRFSAISSFTDNTSYSAFSSFSHPDSCIEPTGSTGPLSTYIPPSDAPDPSYLNKPLPQEPPETAPSHRSAHELEHDRWCTTREHKVPLKTYRGFAKHENEHDNSYRFLPQGPVEETPWGRECALCETANPSKAHLEEHRILQYVGWRGKPITRSRKGNFEELLRKHKTSDEKMKTLPNKWRSILKKKAYSCGFCVGLFKTLPERTAHIDREHYAKGVSVDEWDDNLVIKGLLLQSDVKKECIKLFNPLNPTLAETKVSWPPSVTEELQLRLEMMEEPAATLAVDVFRQASNRPMILSSRNSVNVKSHNTSKTSSPSRAQSANMDGAVDASILSSGQSREFPESLRAMQNVPTNNFDVSDVSPLSAPTPWSNMQSPEFTSQHLPQSTKQLPETTIQTTPIYPTYSAPYDTEQPFALAATPSVMASDGLDRLDLGGSNALGILPFETQTSGDFPCHMMSSSMFPSQGPSQPDSLYGNTLPLSQDQSLASFQPPKRKLSDKSAKAANLSAQTQAPGPRSGSKQSWSWVGLKEEMLES